MIRSAPPPLPAIVIAAGGAGQRIGGRKPARTLGGKPLLTHAIEWATGQSDCLALAVQEASQGDRMGLPVLCDTGPARGPISALVSAFDFAAEMGREHVMLIGCDQPFLPLNLARSLSEALGSYAVAMPVSHGRYQPLAAFWRVDRAALADYKVSGGNSLWRFAAAQGVIHVDWPAADGPDPFFNINDAADLAEAEAYLSVANRAAKFQ